MFSLTVIKFSLSHLCLLHCPQAHAACQGHQGPVLNVIRKLNTNPLGGECLFMKWFCNKCRKGSGLIISPSFNYLLQYIFRKQQYQCGWPFQGTGRSSSSCLGVYCLNFESPTPVRGKDTVVSHCACACVRVCVHARMTGRSWGGNSC